MTPSGARMYGGRDASEREAERRQRFIEAGVTLFGTIGYHATSVRVLTAEARLNNRYFYECFGAMEDLLIACYEHLMSQLIEQLVVALNTPTDNLEDRLRRGARCYFEAVQSPHFARITQVEVLGVSQRVDAIYIQAMADLAELTLRVIRDRALAADIDKPRLDVIGAALVGAMMTAGAHWVRTRYQDPIDVMVDGSTRVLLGTFMQVLEPEQQPAGELEQARRTSRSAPKSVRRGVS